MSAGTTMTALTVRGRTGGPRLQGAILAVDDDETIRSLFLELFRPEGVSIRVAASGREAMAMVKQSAPALMIIDVSLPDQDGIAVLEEALAIDNRIIGVVMTGSATVELAVRAMKAGATDFLMKPVDSSAVVTTARRLLELYRLRAEQTVLKYAAVRSGAFHLSSLPLQTFGDDGSLRGEDGLTEFERGLREGKQCAEEERRHERMLFAGVMRKLAEAQSSLRRTMEDEIAALAIHIASKVLHESAAACNEQIVAQAKSAMAAVRESGVVVIQVHPADAPALESARAELAAQRDLALTVKVEPTASITRGSCLLHTANRVIDASLDTQLLRLGDALKNRANDES
jgi:FixJ family two-component response regulator/F0F1-type ATP synthase delta subunit